MNTQYSLNTNQYFSGKYPKTHFILHHTAGNSVKSAFDTWKADAQRVGTSRIIDRNGELYQVFPPESFAYALGIRLDKSGVYANMKYDKDVWEKGAIQYELISWGWLTKKNGKYYSYAGVEVPADEVEQVAYRGYEYWHKYTDAQIAALWDSLHADAKRFNLPLKVGQISTFYDDKRSYIAAHSPSNYAGKNIFTHVNFRIDKTDCYPCKRLSNMLENINGKLQAASLISSPIATTKMNTTHLILALGALGVLGLGVYMYETFI